MVLDNALILLSPVYLSVISRWHGGGYVGGSPKWMKNAAWALPHALATFSHYWYDNQSVPVVAGAVLLSTALTFGGKATSHGGGIDLAKSDKEPELGTRKPERLEFLISWAKPYMSRYCYDALLLALVGLAANSSGIIIALVNPIAGMLVLAGGLFKSVAYILGHLGFTKAKTDLGEFLTGFFSGLSISTGLVIR